MWGSHRRCTPLGGATPSAARWGSVVQPWRLVPPSRVQQRRCFDTPLCAGAHREPVHSGPGGPPERGDCAGNGARCAPACSFASARGRTQRFGASLPRTHARMLRWWVGGRALNCRLAHTHIIIATCHAGHQHPRGKPVAVLHLPVHTHDPGVRRPPVWLGRHAAVACLHRAQAAHGG